MPNEQSDQQSAVVAQLALAALVALSGCMGLQPPGTETAGINQSMGPATVESSTPSLCTLWLSFEDTDNRSLRVRTPTDGFFEPHGHPPVVTAPSDSWIVVEDYLTGESWNRSVGPDCGIGGDLSE